MAIRNTYAAEAWDKVYSAFQQVNFTSYDYDTVKESLIQYLKIYHAEHFNDFIESSELMAILELFAYVAELLAYRVDTMSHENFITTAQRKQSILRLARLISYRASRNIPARGLVKIGTVRTTEDVFDSLGNNLANTTITWNDPNNSNWKEQFFLVMNKGMTTKFGQPSKSFQIGDVLMQLYTFNNTTNTFRNGVYKFTAAATAEQIQMEVVPADVDENGPFERAPDANSQMSIIYAVDGRGDGSDYTGFLMYVKQGSLLRTDYTISEQTSNRRIELDAVNINDTDVWVYRVDDDETIIENWRRVETLNEQNLQFNDSNERKKYEIETLENDRIALIFGDGYLSDAPVGNFQLWTRTSVNQDISIAKNRIIDEPLLFSYVNPTNNAHQFDVTFSLTASIQNNSASETIEHIRQSAPSTYYAQNRMVNGQDYNTYMLRDTTILRLKTINRTFAGQPKYIEWNDASQKYENVKIFGDDLRMYLDVGFKLTESNAAKETAFSSIIEPYLQSNAYLLTHAHIMYADSIYAGIITYPRRIFTDGTDDPADNEKQMILDKMTIGSTSYSPYFGLRYNRFTNMRGSGIINLYDITDATSTIDYGYGDGVGDIGTCPARGLDFYRDRTEVLTIEMTSDGNTFTVHSNLRGRLPNYSLSVSGRWSAQTSTALPVDFQIGYDSNITPAIPYEAGDAFVIHLQWNAVEAPAVSDWRARVATILAPRGANLNGSWTIIESAALDSADLDDGPQNVIQKLDFNISHPARSWVMIIKDESAQNNNSPKWKIWNRDIKIVVESESTNFWYNQNEQILDYETKKPVFDKIRILRSNLDYLGKPLQKADIYDVVAFITEDSGEINFNKLEVIPTGILNYTGEGDSSLDNIIQFEQFSTDSYEYFIVETQSGQIVRYLTGCDDFAYFGYDVQPYDYDSYDVGSIHVFDGIGKGVYNFDTGDYISQLDNTPSTTPQQYRLARRKKVPPLKLPNSPECFIGLGLDFMWQHFSGSRNLIDPSVTNIHDAFILTRGYYTSVIDYVRGNIVSEPAPPTPVELRTSYGYLLNNKMLSDTVVLHSAKIKLLFGQKADQRFRAKFRVVKSTSASFSNERIRNEVLNVINTYFNIENWDFGQKFYATELLGLIHQKLPTQIASVVIVPTYSVSYFGTLFTIDAGVDEILQSAATINDIEIVDELTSTVLRQSL